MNLRGLLRPIRVRLTLWYLLLLTAVLILFSLALYLALRITLYDELDDALQTGAKQVADALTVDDQGRLIAGYAADLWTGSGEADRFWRVVDGSGHQLAARYAGADGMDRRPIAAQTLAQALAGQELFETYRAGGEPLRLYAAPVTKAGRIVGVVQVGLSQEDVNETLNTVLWILILILPLTLAVASVGGLFLASRALRPVDRMTRAAQSITASDLGQRLNLDLPDDELGRLAQTLDAMIARLDTAFRRQRRFTADASHELRTPLTVIKGDVSLALTRPRDADYYHGVLTEVEEEVDQMSRLVDRLLALARADAEGVALHRRPVDLAPLLRDIVEQVRPLAKVKGLGLTAQLGPELTINADADAVTQVMLNLLDNAIKYTPSGQVHLQARRVSGPGSAPPPSAGTPVEWARPAEQRAAALQISVSDSGPGIPAAELPHIFERFYRVDRARSREQGGAGLGLAIARELARAHGGDVTVDSVAGQGSTFTVHLPK